MSYQSLPLLTPVSPSNGTTLPEELVTYRCIRHVVPPSPPTAPRHVENEKTPFEAFCNLSAHDRSLQCKLTAALLYFDFQHIMRPDRVKNLEERTQYYCRRLDRLQGKERERAAVQLFQSSQAIQAASRALKVVDETVRYLENSIFFSQSASTFLPKDSPTSVSPPERTGPNDQDHWTSPAYQAGAASMQSSVIAAEATDDVSGLLDSDITPESSDESHRASAKSSLSPPDNTCSSTSTPATDALHIQHGSDILESVRDEAVTCLIDMGSNEDTGFPRMDVDGRASDEIERGWDLFMSFTSANDFLRS